MFRFSEYFSYPQRCSYFQNIFLILKDVWMFKYYSYSQRCLVVQSIILILREGRVRSLHTLYTLCDTLSPHPPLVIMMIMIIMRMLLITMMRTKGMIPWMNCFTDWKFLKRATKLRFGSGAFIFEDYYPNSAVLVPSIANILILFQNVQCQQRKAQYSFRQKWKQYLWDGKKKDRFLKNRVSRAGVAGKDQWMKKLTWKNLNQVNHPLALTSAFITAAIWTSTSTS